MENNLVLVPLLPRQYKVHVYMQHLLYELVLLKNMIHPHWCLFCFFWITLDISNSEIFDKCSPVVHPFKFDLDIHLRSQDLCLDVETLEEKYLNSISSILQLTHVFSYLLLFLLFQKENVLGILMAVSLYNQVGK